MSKWKNKIGGLLYRLKEALTNLISGFGPFKLPSFLKYSILKNAAAKILGRFPPEKRKFVLFGFAGMTALLLVLLIALAAGRPKAGVNSVSEVRLSIAPEELFYPAEPDFMPEFLLERESRRFWTLDDIQHYWKVPGDSQWWRGEIKSIIDQLMEGVP